jgi:hypothetical protein
MKNFTMKHKTNSGEKSLVRKDGFLTRYAFSLGYIDQWSSEERFEMKIGSGIIAETAVIDGRISLMDNNVYHVFIRHYQDGKTIFSEYVADRNLAYSIMKKELKKL